MTTVPGQSGHISIRPGVMAFQPGFDIFDIFDGLCMFMRFMFQCFGFKCLMFCNVLYDVAWP